MRLPSIVLIPFSGLKYNNKFDYSNYGNTHGIEFLIKVLKERIKTGLPNGIKIHKNIRIFNYNEERVFDLLPDQTTPNSTQLEVEDLGGNELFVKLKVLISDLIEFLH